jgi:membrane carboxypeptidase/penicillin-binding protein
VALRAHANLAPYVAGKTGTSDDENDAWFVGFSNEATVAVWLGYDNADGKRRTLGGGATGGGVAVPIFEPVMEAVWAHVTPRTVLAPPSPEANRQLSCKSVDRGSGTECFRINVKGKIIDTQYLLISRASAYARGREGDREERSSRQLGKHVQSRESDGVEERSSRRRRDYTQSPDSGHGGERSSRYEREPSGAGWQQTGGYAKVQ